MHLAAAAWFCPCEAQGEEKGKYRSSPNPLTPVNPADKLNSPSFCKDVGWCFFFHVFSR